MAASFLTSGFSLLAPGFRCPARLTALSSPNGPLVPSTGDSQTHRWDTADPHQPI